MSTDILLEKDLNQCLHSLDYKHYADNLLKAGITTLKQLSASNDICFQKAGIKGRDATRLWARARIRVNPSYSTTRMGRSTSGVSVTRMAKKSSGTSLKTIRTPSCGFCESEYKFGHSGKEGVTCGMCKSRVGPYKTIYGCESCHQICCYGCRWGMPRPDSESESEPDSESEPEPELESEPDSVPVVLPGAKGPSEP